MQDQYGDYIVNGIIQWGPFQGATKDDLLDEEWNSNAIVSQGEFALRDNDLSDE